MDGTPIHGQGSDFLSSITSIINIANVSDDVDGHQIAGNGTLNSAGGKLEHDIISSAGASTISGDLAAYVTQLMSENANPLGVNVVARELQALLAAMGTSVTVTLPTESAGHGGSAVPMGTVAPFAK